jgi:hypothetical protein
LSDEVSKQCVPLVTEDGEDVVNVTVTAEDKSRYVSNCHQFVHSICHKSKHRYSQHRRETPALKFGLIKELM